MLTTRHVVIAAIVVIAVSVGMTVVSLLRDPDSDGLAADSFGTHRDGQRALYQTLAELNLPVERHLAPPDASLPHNAALVLWSPDPTLIAMEPRHLQELSTWVESGGTVIVAAPEKSNDLMVMDLEHADTTVWEALGIDDVTVYQLSRSQLPLPTDRAGSENDDASVADRTNGDRNWTEDIESLMAEDIPRVAVAARVVGTLQQRITNANVLTVPGDKVGVILESDDAADGAVQFDDVDGKARTLIAAYGRGRGSIIVVGDPMLFNNFALGNQDNSVVAVQLLAGGGGPVVFDEFYHGLSVRGNPFWLLIKPGYAVLTITVIGLVCLATWRSAVLLGPPLETSEPSRRALGEYIDAMARFFNRSRRSRRFLTQGVYDGTLWHIAREHRMTGATHDAQRIAATVARREPERGDRLREAADAVDAVLGKRDKGGEHETLTAIQGITDCL